MKLHPRLTPATVALVKRFETFQPVAERTPQGGHTASAREGGRVSRADAEALLIYDLDRAARAVERALFAPVTRGQFEALTALCFNLGEPAFLRSSALARVNAGAELDAADEIERWRQAELGAGTQVVDALVRRRAAEKAHFLGLPDGAATWPSGQRRPLALPGGETPAPTATVGCEASAVLAAANDVQARLRRMIPDEEAPNEASSYPASPDTSLSQEPDALAHDAAAFDLAGQDGPETSTELQGGPDVAWEPTPPPFDPSAPPSSLKVVEGPDSGPVPETEPPVVAADEPASQMDGRAAAPEAPAAPAKPAGPGVARARNLSRAYTVLALLGVALFIAGVAMILAGRASLLDLGIGIVGVLLAVPALYGLLGAPRASGPARWPRRRPRR
jgi:lysozyme